jgi:Dullard-like phosphatase family protein
MQIGINVRPFVKEALKQIMNDYVIIVYTASHQTYADEVLNYLDPKNEIFAYRLYRHNCIKVRMENENIFVKDLRIFKNIDLKKIIIIDNSALSFAFHLDNGIPILPYYDNKDDDELLTLVNYLNCIAKVDDLREENKKFLKMHYFLQKACNEQSDESEILDESVNEYDSFYNSDNNQHGLLVLNPCKNESPNTSIEHNYNSNDSGKKHKTRNFQELLFQSLEDFSHHFRKK